MEILFWVSVLLIGYIYVGYPLLIYILSFQAKIIQFESFNEDPAITIIIPAYNEADVIEETITNKLDQDYPAAKIQVVVVSDESTDGTDELVKKIISYDDRVSLIRQEPRKGKTAGLNRAISEIDSDLIVFCDANGCYEDGALRALSNVFTDPSVGYVTGKMVYVNADGNLIGDGCSAYMKYENYLRALETKSSSIVGVDGGVDAIRRELYRPMNDDQLPDFVQPLKVVEQGFRVVYEPLATVKEKALDNEKSEFSMRLRVSLRAFWAMWDMKTLFNPFKFKLFSLQLLSHKLLRYLAFIPLLSLLVSSLVLSTNSIFYGLVFLVQLFFYGLAIYAYKSDSQDSRLAGFAYYFCLINLAAAIAFYKFLCGEKIVIWKPRLG